MPLQMEITEGDKGPYRSKHHLHQSTSSESIFQAKYDLCGGGVHHIKKVISERYTEEERLMSMSPTPKKLARVDPDSQHGDLEKKGLTESKTESDGFFMDTSDPAVHIKSEPPDDAEKGQIKEPISFQYTPPRIRSNSLHSSTRYFPTRQNESHTSTVSSAHRGRGRPRRPSVSSEGLSMSSSASKIGEVLPDQPDSSTGSCEQLMQESGRRHSVSSMTLSDDQSSVSLPASTSTSSSSEAVLCQVCGDLAAGFYCDAYICEACKKFFIRASKLERPRYVCLRQKNCIITKESRVHCQYCRYQKCLQLNMHYSKDGQKSSGKIGVQEIPCRVCSAPSSGFHFGALTCEGCKGFFRRMVKEREAYSYKCSRNGSCEVNAMTRNMCKACRYSKCLQIGMSVEGSRIGRQPNAVKHAISLEAKKQAALKTEPENGSENSSPTNFNFDSIVLDPCLSDDMDDSFHSIDTGQDLASADASLPKKTEEIKLEQAPLPPSSRDSCSSGVVQNVSSTAPQQHSDVFRIPHQIVPSPTDHNKHLQSSYSANMSPSPMALTAPRNSTPLNTGRPWAEAPSPSSDNQPQDLSMDLSISRAFATSSNHSTSHPSMQASNHKSHHALPPAPLPPPAPHLLPCDLPKITSDYSVRDHTSQNAHNYHRQFFHSNSGDEDEHHRSVYQQRGSYGDGCHAFDVESYNHYGAHDSVHVPQQEEYVSLSCQSPHTLGHFSSPSPPSYNGQQGVLLHQIPQYNVHGSELLQQPQLLITQQNNRDKLCTYSTDQQLYTTHVDGGDVFRNPSSQPVLPERSFHLCDPPAQLVFNLSPQHWSRSTSDVMPPSSSYVAPQFQPPSPSVTPQKEMRPSPASTPNFDILEAPSPAPIPEKIAASRDQNYMSMSNDELNAVILDAAKNLAHICVVNRAKSNIFDAEKFKDVDSIWEKMMEHFHFHAKCIVRFAKRVPGFRSLKIDDQVLLLRMSTYSLVILNHSRTYEMDTGFYNYFNFTQKEIMRIRELFPEFDVIHSHYKHTGVMAQRLGLTEMEYAYMSCMLLLNDGHAGLEDIEKTKELKERFMDAFQEYEIGHFSSGSHRFGEMLMRLNEFSQISMQHNVAVGLVITKNSQLHIPQLYAEMYAQSSCVVDSSDPTS